MCNHKSLLHSEVTLLNTKNILFYQVYFKYCKDVLRTCYFQLEVCNLQSQDIFLVFNLCARIKIPNSIIYFLIIYTNSNKWDGISFFNTCVSFDFSKTGFVLLLLHIQYFKFSLLNFQKCFDFHFLYMTIATKMIKE